MQRPSFLVLALGVFAQSLAWFACSDDEQGAAVGATDASDDHASKIVTLDSGKSGGSGKGGHAPVGTGGSNSGNGGSMDAGAGGASGRIDASIDAQGGQVGAGGTAADGSVPTALGICIRLQTPSVLAFDMTRAYDHKVFGDCRVKWVIDLYLDVDQRATFLNDLLAWNMRFWGCTPPAPANFGLIFKPAPLTSTDAAALIDDYIELATPTLGLSDPEIKDMRAALNTLAKSVVSTVSDEFSKPQCSGDAGNDASSEGGAARDASRDAESGS